jgi:hypothetical protein
MSYLIFRTEPLVAETLVFFVRNKNQRIKSVKEPGFTTSQTEVENNKLDMRFHQIERNSWIREEGRF